MKKILGLIFIFSISFNSQAFTPDSLQEINSKETLATSTDKTFVFFWATWCTSCKTKLKTIIPEMRKNKKIDVLTVNIDKNPRRVKHYIKKNGIQVPVYRVKEGAQENLIEQLDVRTAPQWAIFAKEGNTWKKKEHHKTFEKDQVKKALSEI